MIMLLQVDDSGDGDGDGSGNGTNCIYVGEREALPPKCRRHFRTEAARILRLTTKLHFASFIPSRNMRYTNFTGIIFKKFLGGLS